MTADELDIVAAVCLDPSITRKWREAMRPSMDGRVQWLKDVVGKGF